jgi:hypothetical protein
VSQSVISTKDFNKSLKKVVENAPNPLNPFSVNFFGENSSIVKAIQSKTFILLRATPFAARSPGSKIKKSSRNGN